MTAWRDRISTEDVVATLRRARERGLDIEPTALFHDLDFMAEGVKRLQDAFPARTLHAVAIKANPLPALLQRLVQLGCGLEAASFEEVELALAAGCPPERILFDSPAKTSRELAAALNLGVGINADSFDELARIDALAPKGSSLMGVRVNPQVGSGAIAATSVAGTRSRFGVPIDQAAKLLAAFQQYPWLNSIHCHVGSQGCPFEQLVEAAVRVEQLVTSIETACGRRLERIDLGGGLPVAYRSSDEPPSMEAYSGALRMAAPSLFERPLATEFGRWIHANAGWVVSRAEYVKDVGGEPQVVLHVGADLLLRVAYRPENWQHEFIVLDERGEPRRGDERPQTIVGPLCFAGDVLARSVVLPRVREGDLVVIRDTGAYTLSMWSRHCSRGIPTVLGSDSDGVRVLRRRETARDVVRFWEGP